MASGQVQLKIRIMRQAYTKLFYFVDKCDVEIGFMGKVVFNPAKMSYDILSVHVPEQEVTGSTTDLDAQAVAKLDCDTIGEKGHLNAWLHSHVNMGVFWSGTDKDTIKEIGEQGLCVAVVVNKKREIRGAIYWKGNSEKQDDFFPCFPVEGFVDEVPVEVVDVVNDMQEWNKELEAKVKKKVYESNYPHGRYNNQTGKWEYNYTGKHNPSTTTATVIGGGGTTINNVAYYLDQIETFKEQLQKTCTVGSNGQLILTHKQKKRLDYLTGRLLMAEQKEREQEGKRAVEKQLALVKPSEEPAKFSGTMDGDQLYTDEQLFELSFTDLKAELDHLVKTHMISPGEAEDVVVQWRTCLPRLEAKKKADGTNFNPDGGC